MLQRLYIQNVALISELSITFSNGLNIITGETGAGKSIIIDSINLVLGDRSGKELIKTGENRAKVEATFDITNCKEALAALDEEGIEADDDNTITISRELSTKSDSATVKSVCRINGSMVSLASLRSITEHIVDVHGQHEHQSLLAQPKHIGYLDAYAAATIHETKEEVKSLYKQYHKLQNEMHSGFMSEQDRIQRIDVLSYQISEIDTVSPMLGEDDALESERKILANSERIKQALYNAGEMLCNGEGGALTSSKAACNELYPIADLSQEYRELTDALGEAYYALEAAAYAVRDTADMFSFDAQRLDEVEARLSLISTLKRKYGSSIESILVFFDKANSELAQLTGSEEKRQVQQAELDRLKNEYMQAASVLSQMRNAAANEFSKRVTDNLLELGLKKSTFSVSVTALDGDMPSADGIDYVEFMFSANPGEPEKPLRKVASGGEISRVMLALKSVLSNCEEIGTMIFDEIDSGISGETATVVGLKMKSIAREKQVLAITHLPQIAAFADCHYLVEKIQTEQSTNSNLRKLSNNERAQEVARIMGGADSQLATMHAHELIENAQQLSDKAAKN